MEKENNLKFENPTFIQRVKSMLSVDLYLIKP